MAVMKITDGVYSVGAVDYDRRLFDELIPLPDGTSYNSYLIIGSKKTALIDTVDPAKQDELLENLKELGVDRIDYVVSNHAEQDHSGSIPEVLKIYPDAKVVTNPKCKAFLKSLLLLEDDVFVEVKDGERISLGDKTLEFIYTPFVHWPETMSTYLVEDGILFSCDFFGSHRAASHLFVQDECEVLKDAKRYYAEIMIPFRFAIRKNIEKVKAKQLRFIAPSHGPVYPKPSLIIDAYLEWISDEVEKKVVVPYVSMHGSVEKMVSRMVNRFIESGVEVVPLNLTTADVGVLAMELVDAAGVIFGTPYVLSGIHPAVAYAAYLVNALRPKARVVSAVISYGWGGLGVEHLKNLLSNLDAELIEPLLVNGYPDDSDFEKVDSLVENVLEKI